jgi:hypothetical protein
MKRHDLMRYTYGDISYLVIVVRSALDEYGTVMVKKNSDGSHFLTTPERLEAVIADPSV